MQDKHEQHQRTQAELIPAATAFWMGFVHAHKIPQPPMKRQPNSTQHTLHGEGCRHQALDGLGLDLIEGRPFRVGAEGVEPSARTL